MWLGILILSLPDSTLLHSSVFAVYVHDQVLINVVGVMLKQLSIDVMRILFLNLIHIASLDSPPELFSVVPSPGSVLDFNVLLQIEL